MSKAEAKARAKYEKKKELLKRIKAEWGRRLHLARKNMNQEQYAVALDGYLDAQARCRYWIHVSVQHYAARTDQPHLVQLLFGRRPL